MGTHAHWLHAMAVIVGVCGFGGGVYDGDGGSCNHMHTTHTGDTVDSFYFIMAGFCEVQYDDRHVLRSLNEKYGGGIAGAAKRQPTTQSGASKAERNSHKRSTRRTAINTSTDVGSSRKSNGHDEVNDNLNVLGGSDDEEGTIPLATSASLLIELGPGDSFGAAGLDVNATEVRNSSIVARTRLCLWKLPKADYHHLFIPYKDTMNFTPRLELEMMQRWVLFGVYSSIQYDHITVTVWLHAGK